MEKKTSTLRWLWDVTGRKRWNVAVLTVATIVSSGIGVFYALLMRGVVDAAASQDAPLFWRSVTELVLLVAGQLLLRVLVRRFDALSRSELENALKRRLFDQLLQKDYAAVSAVHSGEWLHRLTSDSVVVARQCVDLVPGLCGMAAKLISALALLTALDARFVAVLLPGGIAVSALAYAFRKILKRLHKRVQEADVRLRIFLQERIGSLMILRSFAAEERTRAEADEKMREHRDARMRKNRFSSLCSLGFGLAMNGMYLFGVVWCGYGLLTGAITFGTLTAITQLIAQIQSPFANITGYLPRYYAMTASAERLMELESLPDDADAQDALPLDEVTDYYKTRFAAVALEDVRFAYYPAVEKLDELQKDGRPSVLEGVSVRIGKGEVVAFAGHSGCGKSTVLKLMMCVYRPDGGRRLVVDRDGGTRELSGRWRRLFAYVPQGNHLMRGTIREAVSLAAPERAGEDEALWQALRVACAEEYVRELDQGLDTRLGERGAGLSEGQMQRLAIARAIFSDSPVLMLDEATSALDAQTERRLLENLRRLTDRTVVIVTHRPAALEICDRVLRFSEDGIREQHHAP